MPSWHQAKAMNQNPAPLWHKTKWTVVTDNGFLSVERHDDADTANERAKILGGYVLQPERQTEK